MPAPIRRLTPPLLCAAALVLLAGSWIGGPAAATAVAVAAAGFPVALIVLAVPLRRGLGRWLVALLLLLETVTLAILVQAGTAAASRGGLLLMLVGLTLVPLLLVGWAHAATWNASAGGSSGGAGGD